MWTELIGIFASGLIIISICSNTQKEQGIIILRLMNLIGSIVYIYYGYLIHSYSIIFLDFIAAIVNSIYLYKHIKNKSSVKS